METLVAPESSTLETQPLEFDSASQRAETMATREIRTPDQIPAWSSIEEREDFQGLGPLNKLRVARAHTQALYESLKPQLDDNPVAAQHFATKVRQMEDGLAEKYFPGAWKSLIPQLKESGKSLGRSIDSATAAGSVSFLQKAQDELAALDGVPDGQVVGTALKSQAQDPMMPPTVSNVPITAAEKRLDLKLRISEAEGRIKGTTERIVQSLDESAKVPPSKAMFQFQNSKGLGDFWNANPEDPWSSVGALIMGLGAESAASMAISAGATTLGTLATGGTGAFVAGGAGAGIPEYLATFQDELLSRVDGQPTEEKLVSILESEDFQNTVTKRAATRAGTIAAVEGVTAAVSAGVANKLLKVGKEAAFGRRLAGGLAAAGVENALGAVGGSTGEYLAQLFSGQKINFKEVQAEGIAELIGAPGATLGAAFHAAFPGQAADGTVQIQDRPAPATTEEAPIEFAPETEPEPVAEPAPEEPPADDAKTPPDDTQEPLSPISEAQRQESDETTSFNPAKVPVQEVPIAEISLSEDVPQFKENADPDTGVVEGQQLEGEYQRLGTPPIVLWRRADTGKLEVITGRHRLDLAQRSGEETIPSQIVDESKGFTREMAMVFDAASNIRDGQGTVRDYADFFRLSEITEEEARQAGMLSRAKGQSGFDLGRNASDDLYALYRAEKITEARAVAIAQAAPNNPEAQQIGIKYALEKKDPAFISNIIKASGAESVQRGETMDLFGSDDAAMKEMERRASRASQFQRAIQDRITAAQSAAKRPEAAKKMGIDVSDPEAVRGKIAELKDALGKWQNWPMHPELVSLVTGETDPADVADSVIATPASSATEEAGIQLFPTSDLNFHDNKKTRLSSITKIQKSEDGSFYAVSYTNEKGEKMVGFTDDPSVEFHPAFEAKNEAGAQPTPAPRLTEGANQGDIFDSTGQDTGFQLVGEEGQSTEFTPPDNRTQDEIDAENGQDIFELGMMAPGMAALNNPVQNTGQVQQQQSPSSLRGKRMVNPDPITGQGTKPTSQILFDAAKSIGANVQYKGQSRKSLGTYYPGSAKVAVRYEGDLDTTAHEIAHALDDRLGIVAKWAIKRKRSPFDAELKPFADVTTPKGATLAYRRAEGVAEWIRAWLVNPDEAIKAAPKFAAHFEKTVPEKTRNDLRKFGDDIRRFAGATGAEQVLANVRWRPDSTAKRLKSLIVGNKANGFQVTFWDKLAKHVTDSLAPFEHAMTFAKAVTGEKPLPSRDPMVLARLYAGVNGKADTVFEDGMIDTRGNRATGGGVTWLLQPFDTTSQETLEADQKDAVALMIAQRTLEKAGQLERDDNIAGIGGGIFDDTEVANRTISELQQNPTRFSRLEEGAKRYRQWARANLQYLVDSGRLSKEEFQNITAANAEYVAMNRLREVEPGVDASEAAFGQGGVRLGSVNNPLQKFKGSSKTIENPYSTLLYATHQVLREGDRNNVMASVAELLSDGRSMYQGDPKDLAAIGAKTNSADPQKIAVWRDGKKEYWRFDKDVHDALKGLTESVQFPGWVTALPRLLRFGVTRMPAFAARNVIRDVQNRLTVTRSGTRRAVRDTFRLRGNMDPTLLKLYGGDQFGYYAKDRVDYMRAMDAAVSELVDDPKTILIHPKRMGAALKRLGRGYDNLLQKGEYFNRMAEFHSAFDHAKKDLGYSDYDAGLYAAAQSRDLIDFAVAGVTMRYINQIVPFANPAVQGLRRTIRAAKENPAAFAVRWTLYAAIPSILTRAIAEALDYDDEYDQLPAYQRDLFWNFKVADDLWIRIPKNFEMGVLGAFPDRLYSKLKGDENAFDRYGGSLIRTLAPIDETAIAGPLKSFIGVISNYDWFRQTNIVSPYEAGTDLDLRKSDSASRIGKAYQALMEASGLGDTKFGRLVGDARVADYLFRENLGIFGDTMIRASNTGREDTNKKLGLRDTGLTTTTPAWAARDVQEAFNIAERRGVSTQSKTFSDLNYLLEKYFDSETKKERQKWAEEVQKEGTRLRAILEEALKNGDI